MDKRLLDMDAEIARLDTQYRQALHTWHTIEARGRNAYGWFKRAGAISLARGQLLTSRDALLMVLAAQHNTALPGKTL